ncbi:MAG TPA: outer membrane beta-barrel protein [Flavobacterium sp.]
MKKIILSAAAVLAFGFANAQEEQKGNAGFAKGDLFISGAVGINSESEGDEKSSGFLIEPKIGFFVTEKIAVGGKLGFASDKGENQFGGTGDTTDETTLTLGAFGRYYFTPASQFSLFGELGVDYSSVDNKLTDNQENEIGVGLGLGVSYFLSKNFAIEAAWAGLRYKSNDNGGDGADKTDSFYLGADLRAITLGLTYKF